ncbi:MAG TPA: DUF3631 domain-containing protein, partial [Candidatus Dormibacteraeota bacterium]|nr:DUF3631 domain-containing protein [Candidatus Dormibacteraeota bacterium]
LSVLAELVNRAVVSSNISSPAFFRVIEELGPTLLIDEADTFLKGNDELRGILNSGYKKNTAYVVRVTHELPANNPFIQQSPASRLVRFSSWCPKAISTIGPLPDTLSDRCITIRMQRKTMDEQCERLRNLDATDLRRQCARFVLDHAGPIASAAPMLPAELNDRAADIWEPLFIIADLAGGDWPSVARQAAVRLTASTQDSNPLSSLLLDIFITFTFNHAERLFSRDLVHQLTVRFTARPWAELRKGRPITDLWLAQTLRPYGIRPRNMKIDGIQAKGYSFEEFTEVFQRYIPRSEVEALRAELASLAERAK